MPLFPLPAVIALAGWCFIFLTSAPLVILYSVISLAAGVVAFYFWDVAACRLESRSVADASLASGSTTE
jgi:hypothetical protein